MTKCTRILILAIFILFTGCSNIRQSKKENENKHLFDFDWKFHLGDVSEASTEDFDDSQWRSLDLPHDWSIEGKFNKENPAGNDGGYLPTGIGWYRKTFMAPSEWKERKISVYFEGIYMNSEVFINGKSLGVQPYGYSSFSYDLTPYLKINEENIISVRVNNAEQKNCRWYSGSGIYRHAWLIVKDKIHIKHWGVGISTPKVNSKEAIVEVKTSIVNTSDSPQELTLYTQISDKSGKKRNDFKTEIKLEPYSEKQVVQNISISSPLLWSTENPELYCADIVLLQNDQTVDRTVHEFGIRSIDFSVEKGFLLNGNPVVLNGGCVHHDNGCLGAAAYDRAEERRVELLKSAGFNAVRTAHNPPSDAFLDACDRLGLLVIDEAFDGWRTKKNPFDFGAYFDEWSVKDLQAMVLRDRNHPSIIMWSIGNEIIERKSPEALETAKMLRDAVRMIDTTRPVTSAMTTWDQEWEIFDPLMAAHDICGYNYQLHRAPADHIRVPSRIIINTESYPANAFNIWKLVSQNNYIIGDFVWTALDYIGESGIGAYYYPGEEAAEHWQSERFPWHGAYCGDIDLLGWRKPISHYRSMLYNDDENLYMAVREPNPIEGEISLTGWAVWPTWESWTWPGYEGENIDVEVYSKYPEVRLYLNDELIDERSVGENTEFKATFKVPYTPGVIKVVGMENGKEKQSKTLQTADIGTKIKLTADRKEIIADGQDLSFVMVEITDIEGIPQPNASNKLKFDLQGPGVIVAVDNANLKDNTPYVSNTRNAWKGKALVVIKSTRETGDILLMVKSSDLEDTSILIKTINHNN